MNNIPCSADPRKKGGESHTMNPSIWTMPHTQPRPEPLDFEKTYDVVIIGAGICGVLCGYELYRRGHSVVLLEAGEIGSGTTMHTTAKITAQHGVIYRYLIDTFGMERAQQYAMANQKAVEDYQRIIQEEKIDCDFALCNAYIYAKSNAMKLAQEAEAAGALGLHAFFCPGGTPDLPFPVEGRFGLHHQAQFHPLKFLYGIAEKLPIHAHTPVVAIEKNHVVLQDGRLRADHIILATHYPFINIPGYYFLKMYQQRSYVIAFPHTERLSGMYLDAKQNGLSLRQYQGYLLLGGSGHRTGVSRGAKHYFQLERLAQDYYGQNTPEYRWSAQDCMTHDRVPYIGRLSEWMPEVYVATGFGKWGMTTSMAASKLLADLIEKKDAEYAPIFSPYRKNLAPSIKSFSKSAAKTASSWIKQRATLPTMLPSDLAPGQGGIVSYQDKKYACYRDEDGQCYLIDCKCPHLGCQLEFNADEKSWDCPCHGSRFDLYGHVLDAPAQEDRECLVIRVDE